MKYDWHTIHISVLETRAGSCSQTFLLALRKFRWQWSDCIPSTVQMWAPRCTHRVTWLGHSCPSIAPCHLGEQQKQGSPSAWCQLFILKKITLPIFIWNRSSHLGKSSCPDPLKTSVWQVSYPVSKLMSQRERSRGIWTPASCYLPLIYYHLEYNLLSPGCTSAGLSLSW